MLYWVFKRALTESSLVTARHGGYGKKASGMSYEPPKPLEWNYCPICGNRLIVAHDGEKDRPHCPGCRRFYYRNPVPAACCFVRRGEDELLFTQRAVEPCRGQWSLPGGFVEVGETTEEAALRELYEETGLRGLQIRLLGVNTKASPISGAILVVAYVVDAFEGELRPDTDAMDAQFFKRHERPPLAFSVHRDLLALYDQIER
jgi:8-oxo-dGTP diphosphatase